MRLIAAVCFSILLVMMANPEAKAESRLPPLPLESIFTGDDFQSEWLGNLQWSADGTRFTFTRSDPATGQLNIH